MTDARIVCKCFGVFLHFEEEVEEAKKQIKLDMELLRTRTSAHNSHSGPVGYQPGVGWTDPPVTVSYFSL